MDYVLEGDTETRNAFHRRLVLDNISPDDIVDGTHS